MACVKRDMLQPPCDPPEIGPSLSIQVGATASPSNRDNRSSHGSFEEMLAAINQEHTRLRARADYLERQVGTLRAANQRINGASSGQVHIDEVPRQSQISSDRGSGGSGCSGDGSEEPKPDDMPTKSRESNWKREASRFAVDDENAHKTVIQRTSSILGLAHPTFPPPLDQVVHSPFFELVSGGIIVISSVLLGLETDHMSRNAGHAPAFFDGINVFINILFCVEFFFRVLVDKLAFFYNKDWRWAWLDCILVTCSLTDLCLSFVHLKLLVVGRILRLLRLFRLIRTVRLVRSLRSVREFHKMIYAVLSSLRTLMCALLIMSFVVYFFSVLLCQGVMELKLGPNEVWLDLDSQYGSVPNAFFTLFAAATTGIDWNEAYHPLEGMHFAYRIAFLVYIALILFGVSNVVTSVFVESAIMSAQHYRELIVQEKQHSKEVAVMHMKEVFRQIDEDGSGEISADEMDHFLSEPKLKSYIDALGISPENTRMLFHLMDLDESGRIDVDEFCEGCLRLQGEAKSMDVHTMIYQVRKFLTKWSEFTGYVEDRFRTLNLLVGGTELLTESQEP